MVIGCRCIKVKRTCGCHKAGPGIHEVAAGSGGLVSTGGGLASLGPRSKGGNGRPINACPKAGKMSNCRFGCIGDCGIISSIWVRLKASMRARQRPTLSAIICLKAEVLGVWSCPTSVVGAGCRGCSGAPSAKKVLWMCCSEIKHRLTAVKVRGVQNLGLGGVGVGSSPSLWPLQLDGMGCRFGAGCGCSMSCWLERAEVELTDWEVVLVQVICEGFRKAGLGALGTESQGLGRMWSRMSSGSGGNENPMTGSQCISATSKHAPTGRDAASWDFMLSGAGATCATDVVTALDRAMWVANSTCTHTHSRSTKINKMIHSAVSTSSITQAAQAPPAMDSWWFMAQFVWLPFEPQAFGFIMVYNSGSHELSAISFNVDDFDAAFPEVRFKVHADPRLRSKHLGLLRPSKPRAHSKKRFGFWGEMWI